MERRLPASKSEKGWKEGRQWSGGFQPPKAKKVGKLEGWKVGRLERGKVGKRERNGAEGFSLQKREKLGGKVYSL